MEERLAKLLRDKLTACTDAEDMFCVFKRFNPLLARTRVRIAVKEFQVQLIATVSKAIEKLQSKFVLKYESSSAARISKLRGIPPVSTVQCSVVCETFIFHSVLVVEKST
ncbi:MAG: dynein heavy chain 1 [Bacillariaceae sp.]|jgi:dynein heavy chain 1